MDLRRVFSRVSGIPASSKQSKEDHFLAVKISSTTILATVWSINAGKIEVGEVGTGVIAEANYAHLLKACDQAISHASANLAPDVSKVIFAVPFDWVHEGKIINEHLQLLRRLCKELDLAPLGYVVTIEALENYYKEVEGAPLTAVLVGVDDDMSVLTLYRAGRDLGTVPLSGTNLTPEDFPRAIEIALKRFPQVDALPSRIILYDSGKDLDSIAQKITAYPWTGRLPFLHFPKVEKAPSEFVIKAVAAAGGLQMGASLDTNEISMSEKEDVLPPTEEIKFPSPEPTSEEEVSNISELEEVSPEEAGFVTQSGFGQINIPIESHQPDSNSQTAFSSIPSPRTGSEEKPEKKALASGPTFNFNSLLKIPAKLYKKVMMLLPTKELHPETRELSTVKKKTIPVKAVAILAGIILVVAAILAGAFYFVPKANLLITVKSQNFNHTMQVKVVSSQTDLDAKSIPGMSISVSEVGTRKGTATGEKLVGVSAKGSVTIYGVSESKTFPASTVIAAANGLKFTLDKEATVASGDATSPSTATVSVHAASIGDDYNLPAGTKFSIGTLSASDYLAKNDGAFTGGSSHQATVVTKLDQDRLSATLSAQLFDQAKTDLESKVAEGQTLLPNAITSQVSKKKFSKDVDAESDSVSLDMTVNFQGTAFSKDDVIKLFSSEFGSDIPNGYSLTVQNTTIDVRDVKTDKNGNATLTISLNANLSPTLSDADIISHAVGHSFASANNYVSHLPGVSQVRLSITPSFFEPLSKLVLPFKKDNLKVEIVTE